MSNNNEAQRRYWESQSLRMTPGEVFIDSRGNAYEVKTNKRGIAKGWRRLTPEEIAARGGFVTKTQAGIRE